MKTASEIGKVVRGLRGDMSLRDFALKCGISHTTLDNIEKGYDFRTGKPVQAKMATLQKISDALNIPLWYIVEDAPVNNRDKIEQLLKMISKMNDNQFKQLFDCAVIILRLGSLQPPE